MRERRGVICLPCNKKFLYRDVKHDLTIKLEVRDESIKATPEELDDEELHYNRMMNELRNLKEAKLTQLDLMREMKPAGGEDGEDLRTKEITGQIKEAMIEKDGLVEELQALREDLDEHNKRIDQIQEDLVKIERAIKRRDDRCDKFDEQLQAGLERIEELKRLAH
jgi:DNA repair exonuclease SbcCD ATPase subunit